MKNLLFPRQFQFIGWLLFIPALILGALIYFGLLSLSGLGETIVNDAVIIGITLGAIFIVCSKERHEDEMTRAIRLSSLLNTLYICASILILSTLLINGIEFLWFAVLNLVLLPIVYVVIFRLEMYRFNKMSADEELNKSREG